MKLYGRNPVVERLRSNPKSIRHIYLQEGLSDTAYICKKARSWSIPVYIVPKSKILKMARNTNAQGVLVDVEDFSYTDYAELIEWALAKKKTLVFLDNLTDPQNLGSIIRTLACLGGFGVVLPTKDSAEITETVLRVASGGDNYIPVAKVSNLASAIRQAQEAGFSIAGAVVGEGKDLVEIDFSYRLGIVIGSEGKGIRDVLKKLLDIQFTIPMAQQTLNLNAAQAVAIIAYEINKQKKPKKAE